MLLTDSSGTAYIDLLPKASKRAHWQLKNSVSVTAKLIPDKILEVQIVYHANVLVHTDGPDLDRQAQIYTCAIHQSWHASVDQGLKCK